MLFEMNLSHVLGVIFQYCKGVELCAIAQVGSMDESVAWLLYNVLFEGESAVEPCLGHQQCAQRSPFILDCHQVQFPYIPRLRASLDNIDLLSGNEIKRTMVSQLQADLASPRQGGSCFCWTNLLHFRLNDVLHVNLYRRVMQQLNNQPRQGGNSGEKRERASSSAALVSPSKVAKSFYRSLLETFNSF